MILHYSKLGIFIQERRHNLMELIVPFLVLVLFFIFIFLYLIVIDIVIEDEASIRKMFIAYTHTILHIANEMLNKNVNL